MKKCTKCGTEKPNSDFYPTYVREGEFRPSCKECDKSGSKSWAKHNPEKTKVIRRKEALKRCGFTPELFNELIQKQKGLCAICKKPSHDSKPLRPDHNHSTMQPRELLCEPCNLGLGRFKEDIELMEKAAKYLDHFNGPTQ